MIVMSPLAAAESFTEATVDPPRAKVADIAMGMTVGQVKQILGTPVRYNGSNGAISYGYDDPSGQSTTILDYYLTSGRVRGVIASGRFFCTTDNICVGQGNGLARLRKTAFGKKLTRQVTEDGQTVWGRCLRIGGRPVPFAVSTSRQRILNWEAGRATGWRCR